MSAGMPELGSKISLISKADIRYEGRLFTVDPQECTIALANVRSFGTEDRETSYPIMPQSTVYDYILFRGSDIKDIRVVNNVAIPNDPAIMQMHLPPQQNFMPQNFGQQQPGGAQVMNQFGLPFNQMQGGNNMGPSMGGMPQQQAQSPIQSQHQGNTNINNLAPGSGSGHKNKKSNSRSGTPQNLSRKSPTSDIGSQTNQNRENQSGANKDKPQRNNQRSHDQQRERRDSGRNEGLENKGRYRNQNPNQRTDQRNNNQINNHQNPQQQQQQQPRGYNNRNQNQNPMRGNQVQGGSARMRGNVSMHQNNYRQPNNQSSSTQNQNKPNGQQQQIRGGKPLKFENEFDFETANSKFEELRLKLQRLKVGSEETKSTDQVNGEVEKKDDSGNETGADHEAEVDENAGYDKNKSFFDNISCEAVERSKGKTQRTDWRTERKLNSETFGYAFNRRGNYRGGRGGFYPRQFNGQRNNYRGGNPNYRPLRNHRNLNNVDGRSNAPVQVIGPQSQSQSAPVTAN